ncbi:hypothetical protein BC937DRAFT_89360 [Endogone sp. FLAS-F59071]|nr:hypothetical protein BC937DRAFT_89360 [Endogone sp. FLAS-F59071]|eukprot:RUS17904.1 hypothetical protein BC937DRAFT_89360 [Endogone sp. FLAS-F59071]
MFLEILWLQPIRNVRRRLCRATAVLVLPEYSTHPATSEPMDTQSTNTFAFPSNDIDRSNINIETHPAMSEPTDSHPIGVFSYDNESSGNLDQSPMSKCDCVLKTSNNLKLCTDCFQRIYVSSTLGSQSEVFPTKSMPDKTRRSNQNRPKLIKRRKCRSAHPAAERSGIGFPYQLYNLDDGIANDSSETQNTSSHQSSSCTSVFSTSGQELQSAETTHSVSEIKCDRCSVKKIACSLISPCEKCSTENVPCIISDSRRRDPGTCSGCVRRKIPCVGNGTICYGCEVYGTPHLCLPKTRLTPATMK